MRMKHLGCILEFTDERNAELMAAYRKAISSVDYIDVRAISEAVVNTPCSRFWVSEERATVVISAMLKQQPVMDNMRTLKREMFQELYDRVVKMRQEEPDTGLFDLVMRAVNSPAPKFYMRPRCAMEIIYKIKNGFYDKR